MSEHDEQRSKIGRQQFTEGMALLAERYNRELSPAMSRVYLEAFVGAGLSGDEFVAGVKLAVITCEFFPTAAWIIAAVRPTGDPKVRGAQVLTALLTDSNVAKHDPQRGRVYSLEAIAHWYGDAAARAVLAIGGTSRLSRLSEQDENFARKDFAAAYADGIREQGERHMAQALGAGAETRRLAPGTKRAAGLEQIGQIAARSTLPALPE